MLEIAALVWRVPALRSRSGTRMHRQRHTQAITSFLLFIFPSFLSFPRLSLPSSLMILNSSDRDCGYESRIGISYAKLPIGAFLGVQMRISGKDPYHRQGR